MMVWKKYYTAAATVSAIAVVMFALASCTPGDNRVASSGGGETVQNVPGDTKPSSGTDVTQPNTRLSDPAAPAATGLSIAIPAGVVLQHGEMTIVGSGFEQGEEVAVSARLNGDGATTLIGRVTADEQGALPEGEGLSVPDWLVSGEHTLIARGERSAFDVEIPLYVRADKLWIEIGNYGVRPTDRLGFVGGGFEPGETVAVFLQGLADSQLAQVVADRAGNISWTEVDVPVVGGGSKTLTLRGMTSEEEVSAVISVVPLTPWIELVPYAGRPGSEVKLHGRGFVPGETVVVTFGQFQDLTATFVADEFGNFFDQAATTVPIESRGGPLQVKATGTTSNTPVSADFNVQGLEPWVGLDYYAGPPGTTVRLRGLGYAVGERVTIRMSDRNSSPVATGLTDEDGTFGLIGMVTIPLDASRDVTFYATGESSKAESSVTFHTIIIPTPVPPPPPSLR